MGRQKRKYKLIMQVLKLINKKLNYQMIQNLLIHW